MSKKHITRQSRPFAFAHSDEQKLRFCPPLMQIVMCENMKTKWILIVFLIFGTQAYADEEMVDYFYVQGVNVNKIYSSQTKEINAEFKYVVAYAVNTKTTWKDDTVGVFLVSKKNGAEILDIFPSERHKDFLPSIREFSEKDLLVSVYSDYGELKKIKYIINLKAETKLVSRIELEPEGIPDDLL